MKHVFYLLAILPILWEIMTLANVKKIHKFVLSLKDKIKYDEYSSIQKSFGFLMTGYLIWSIVGFLSSQWIIFVTLIVLGLIPKKYVWYRWLDSLVSLLLLVFMLLNVYHFKIDIWKLLLSL